MPEIIENFPVAEDFMETARSFGNYDLAFALADLIDNSITAGSKNIEIHTSFEMDEIRIIDDGCGISRDNLILAMKLGSQNPREERARGDLGRFGLGLKTASFSQADRLQVFTNHNGSFAGAEWDLNDCAKFKMKVYNEQETISQIKSAVATKNGTEVVWKELSRLNVSSNESEVEADFNKAVTSAQDELGLIFHRYLSDEVPNEQISIRFNNDDVIPVDPFFRQNLATQALNSDIKKIGKEKIKFSPFILPHYSKLSGEEFRQLGGKEGVVKNSGFYIYRNRRLIIRGTWFKLIPHGELFKLARIMVDIPNALDEQWKITVDKSGAQLPSQLRKRLSSWLENSIIQRSRKVFRHRSDQEVNSKAYPVWFARSRADKQDFKIDTQHPLIFNYLSSLSKNDRDEFKKVIEVIEKCLPVNAIHSAVSDTPDEVVQGYGEVTEELLQWSKDFALKSLANGKKKSEVLNSISLMQPFSNFSTEIDAFLEKENIFER